MNDPKINLVRQAAQDDHKVKADKVRDTLDKVRNDKDGSKRAKLIADGGPVGGKVRVR